MIDGTHVRARPPANATQAHMSCKSTITTNVLCVCNMDMQFTYVMLGGKVVPMTQRHPTKRSMTQSMDSHDHQRVLPITITLFVIRSLLYVYASNKCVLACYVCVCV